MKTSVMLILAMILGAPVQTAPIELCDGNPEQPKTQAGVRAQPCPKGFVGQWTQYRVAGSCDWKPLHWTPTATEMQECVFEIEPQGSPP